MRSARRRPVVAPLTCIGDAEECMQRETTQGDKVQERRSRAQRRLPKLWSLHMAHVRTRMRVEPCRMGSHRVEQCTQDRQQANKKKEKRSTAAERSLHAIRSPPSSQSTPSHAT